MEGKFGILKKKVYEAQTESIVIYLKKEQAKKIHTTNWKVEAWGTGSYSDETLI